MEFGDFFQLLMDKYFERIKEIMSKKKISLRVKFMLQDVQETRKVCQPILN